MSTSTNRPSADEAISPQTPSVESAWLEIARRDLQRQSPSLHEQDLAAALAPLVACLARSKGLSVVSACATLGADTPKGTNDLPPPARVESLGAIYEKLLDHTPSADSTLQPSRRARKGQGAFFTNEALAQPTVERTLAPLTIDANLRLCDPAMGGGAFLLAALRELVHRCPKIAPARFATQCIFGVDTDPVVTRLARIALWLEVGDAELDPMVFANNLRCGDAIVGRRPGVSDPTEFCANGFAWHETWPEVFARGGFDAIVGNPPWDIRKPDSRAFFSRFAPEYGRLGKQEALALRNRLFTLQPELEQSWREHLDHHRSTSKWCREEAYRHQGKGDANCYKLFLELGMTLLRTGGQLGMIMPSGLYTDLGCTPLRRLLLDHSQWRWLFAFENRRSIFPIDGRFKFAPIIVEKGGSTQSVKTAFMRHDPRDWYHADPLAIPYTRQQVKRFSPKSLAFLEFQSERDQQVLTRLYANSRRFSADAPWSISFRREFDLTIDSARFPPITAWEAKGFERDPYDRWVHVDGRVAVPLCEGRMIGHYDFSQKGWVDGRGRRARWRDISFASKRIEPQYLIDRREMIANDPECARDKIAIMAIGSATNERSMFAASLLDSPCGNSAPTLRTPPSLQPALLAVLNSFCYDFALRIRLGGININRFVLEETPLPETQLLAALPELAFATAALSWPNPRFAPAWLALGDGTWRMRPWTACWATTPEDRTRLRAALDAVVALAYGIDELDLDWILRNCELPTGQLQKREVTRVLDPKGFWRVDRALAPEQRLPNRCRAAFRSLQSAVAENCTPIEGCRRFLAAALGVGDGTWDQHAIATSWDLCRQHRDRLRSG